MKVLDRDAGISPGAAPVVPEISSERTPRRRTAMAAAAGFSIIAMFQAALALGAPWGSASWGGSHEGQLPSELRIGSAFAVGVWALAVLIVLKRGGFRIPFIALRLARHGTWIFAALSLLGALPQFASSSNWERFMWGPLALALAVMCLVVARGDESDPVSTLR